MITINKSILHILDASADNSVMSSSELFPDDTLKIFLEKHIEKVINAANYQTGNFYEDSEFKKRLISYLDKQVDFVTFSQDIFSMLNNIIRKIKDYKTTDFLILDITVNNEEKILLLKSLSRHGFMHQVNPTANGIINNIVHQWSLLPAINQQMDEFAVIDKKNLKLNVFAKRYEMEGNMVYAFSEMFLECALLPSEKEAIKIIKEAAKNVAADFGQSELKTITAVKSVIAKEAESNNKINPLETGKLIFADNISMQKEYENKITKTGCNMSVPITQKESTLKKLQNHKLQTDTGIELIIPVNYFENTEFIEFNNNPDGSLSITLKHINNITNRN